MSLVLSLCDFLFGLFLSLFPLAFCINNSLLKMLKNGELHWYQVSADIRCCRRHGNHVIQLVSTWERNECFLRKTFKLLLYLGRFSKGCLLKFRKQARCKLFRSFYHCHGVGRRFSFICFSHAENKIHGNAKKMFACLLTCKMLFSCRMLRAIYSDEAEERNVLCSIARLWIILKLLCWKEAFSIHMLTTWNFCRVVMQFQSIV